MITKYLLDNGHRSIAGIFKADDIQGQNRHRGYVQALQEAGMLYDPDKVIWFHTEDRRYIPGRNSATTGKGDFTGCRRML